MLQVLLTGATGFLGSKLVARMASRPDAYKVTALKRTFSNTWRIAHLLESVEAENIDLNDLARVFERRKYDVIIHCATDYGRKQVARSDIIESNLVLPLRLLEMGMRNNVSAFINTDTMLDKRVSDYTLSKRQFREWLQSLASDIKGINMILEHFYGPGDDATKFVTAIVRSLVRGEAEIALTEGKQRRDFIFIDDVVDAFMRVLESLQALPVGYSEYEVGSGRSISIREMVETAASLAGNSTTQLKFGAIPYRANEPMDVSVNTDRLAKLGWTSKWFLADGLKEAIRAERDLLGCPAQTISRRFWPRRAAIASSP